MARQPRLFIPGYPLHVIMRGVEKRDVFRSDGDRLFFRASLDDAARYQGMAIHAYVFMSNHVHLLVTPDRADSIARTFQSVGPRYTGYFNRHNDRVGTLWQGRHKEILVQTDRYLLACMRYIELNPVRAGLVRSPRDFIWSSHPFSALGREDSMLTPHPTFAALSEDIGRRGRAYLTMFDDAEDRKYTKIFRETARGGWVVGDGAFMEWAAMKTGRRLPKKFGV